MPIYEYKCKKCGEISELLVMPGVVEELKCNKCKCANLEKILSAGVVKMGRGSTSCDYKSSCDTHQCHGGCMHGKNKG